MIPLGFTGAVLSIMGFVSGGGLRSHFLSVYLIILSIWNTMFSQAWEKREIDLAFNFDALEFEAIEEQRLEYNGRHIIDGTTKVIRKEAKSKTRQKRILVRKFSKKLIFRQTQFL